MKSYRIALGFLLASSFLTSAFAADGAIKSVTLSSGGLAEVVRTAPSAGGKVDIEVPLEQVDDVLKSLVVLGGSGSVRQLSLGGQTPVAEVMRRMPFTAEDLGGLSTLLGKLQGVRVHAEGAGRTIEGTILGVSMSEGENGAQTAVLSLLGDKGDAVSVPLTADVSVQILDKAVLAKIAEAASTIGRAKADGARTIEIVLDAPKADAPKTDVEIAYVVPASIWKTAYRIVAGKESETARLQAWAVVENATGEDWNGVSLSLTSGAPVTLKQRLFDRYWRDRPEVPVDVDGSPAPRPDGGEMLVGRSEAMKSMAPMAEPAPAPAMAYEDAADEPQDAGSAYGGMAQATTGQATESDFSAAFDVAGTVDLKAGDTLSVPIVDADVKAERVSLFQPGVSGVHPVASLLLTNDTKSSLPPGIMTLYGDSEGYLGDAQLLGLPAGESRMVSFAVDRKVRVDAETSYDNHVVKIKAVDGMLTIDSRNRTTTTYRIAGAKDGDRTIIIEHPRMTGWEFSTTADSESLTDTAHRLKGKVKAGGETVIEAVDEQIESTTYTLADASPDMLQSFAGEADAATRKALEAIADIRIEMSATESEMSALGDRKQMIEDEQSRIRQNLSAVPEASELAKRYLADMATQEEQLADIEKQRAELQATHDKQTEELNAAIRKM